MVVFFFISPPIQNHPAAADKPQKPDSRNINSRVMTSSMQNVQVVCELQNKEYRFYTSHLESMKDYSAERTKQLEKVSTEHCGFVNVFVNSVGSMLLN